MLCTFDKHIYLLRKKERRFWSSRLPISTSSPLAYMGKILQYVKLRQNFFRNCQLHRKFGRTMLTQKILMIWGFKLLFDRHSYTRNMKLFLANTDSYFNIAVVFSLMPYCPNFPFHMAVFHLVPESTRGNQLSLKPITFYCNEQFERMICIHRSLEKDPIFIRHDKQGLPIIIQ